VGGGTSGAGTRSRDHTYIVDYAFLLRAPDGTVTAAHDRHVEGLFPRAQWLAWFSEAGLPAHSSIDPGGRDVFLGVRR
jgi:hypothetical protein